MKTTVLFFTALLLAPQVALHAADTPPGNLLFLVADQHRGDFLHCAGHPLVQTPSLDRLA